LGWEECTEYEGCTSELSAGITAGAICSAIKQPAKHICCTLLTLKHPVFVKQFTGTLHFWKTEKHVFGLANYLMNYRKFTAFATN